MPELSFRWLISRFLPQRNPCKQAVLGCALLLAAGCGGGGGETQHRLVHGDGYSFSAPVDWKIVRSGREVRAAKGVALLSVSRFPLVRAYRPQLWGKVVPELDRAAAAIADQQRGTVSASETVRISDRQARRYDVAYERDGKKLIERLGFVLRGKTEYLLLCRYESGGDTGACDRLLRSFTLAAA
jgi:hypothetical protein